MTAYRLLSSVICINANIDWPVYWLVLSFHDFPLRRLPSIVPCRIIFGSVSWRQAYPNHDCLRRLMVPRSMISAMFFLEFGGESELFVICSCIFMNCCCASNWQTTAVVWSVIWAPLYVQFPLFVYLYSAAQFPVLPSNAKKQKQQSAKAETKTAKAEKHEVSKVFKLSVMS